MPDIGLGIDHAACGFMSFHLEQHRRGAGAKCVQGLAPLLYRDVDDPCFGHLCSTNFLVVAKNDGILTWQKDAASQIRHPSALIFGSQSQAGFDRIWRRTKSTCHVANL